MTSPYLPTAGAVADSQWTGIYAAKIAIVTDPLGQGRVQLAIPQVLGTGISNWALPMQPGIIPAVGTYCLALFLGGDINAPYYFVGVTASLVEAVTNGTGVLNANPFFAGGLITGWTATGGTLAATAPNASTNPPFTTGALWTAAGTGGGYITEVATPFTAVIGQPYQVQAWVYYPVGGNVSVGFGWTGQADTLSTITVAAGTWSLVSTVATATATTGWPKVGPTTSTAGRLFTAEAVTVIGQIPGQLISSSSISSGQVNFTARQIGGITTTIATSAPAGAKAGDLWWDSTLVNGMPGYKLNQFDGASWNPYQFGTGAFAAGSITAAQIAAQTITASQIAAGTITASQIAAGTITASQINAGTAVATILDGTIITGAQIIADGTSGQLLIYNGPPATGNLVGSWSGAAGNDTHGNTYPIGLAASQVTMTGAGLTNPILTGSTIAGGTINNAAIISGAVQGGSVSQATVTFTGANGVLLAYSGSTTTVTLTSGTSWTAPAGTYTQGKVECWGADAGGGGGDNVGDGGEAGGGGAYSCEPNYPLTPGSVYSTNIGAAGLGGRTNSAGTDGGQTAFDGGGVIAYPGTAGSGFNGGLGGPVSSNTISFPGGNGGNGGFTSSSAGGGGRAGATGPGGNGGDDTLGAGAAGTAGSGTGGIAGGAGVGPSASGNTGGGGSGAGSGSGGTTYQNLFYDPTSTASYYGAGVGGGLKNNNGSMFQGDPNVATNVFPGDQESFANYNVGQMASDWSGWTIDSVSITINNQHSWYNSGCYCILGYVQSGNHFNAISFWTPAGRTTVHDITSVFASRIGSFTAIILGPSSSTAGGSRDLYNYGYYQGGAGAGGPRISVRGHQGSGGSFVAGSGGGGVIKITYASTSTLVNTVSPASGSDAGSNAFAAGYTGPVSAIQPSSSPTIVETWHDGTGLLSGAPLWQVDTDGRFRYRLCSENEIEIDCYHLYGPVGGAQNTGVVIMATAFGTGYVPTNIVQFPVGCGQLAVPASPNNAGAQAWLGPTGKVNVAGISNGPAKNYVNFCQRIPLA